MMTVVFAMTTLPMITVAAHRIVTGHGMVWPFLMTVVCATIIRPIIILPVYRIAMEHGEE